MTQSCLAIVQARMGSARMPGKSLALLCGKPSLEYLIESLRQVLALERIIVATSVESGDQPIADFCLEKGISCHRGNLLDVASRFREILESRKPDSFLRLNGDSPLLDHRVVLELLGEGLAGGYDLVTTVGTPRFPSGSNVEWLRTERFLQAFSGFSDPAHFEHVTRYFYERPGEFRIKAIPCPLPQAAGIKLSLDTPEDYARISRVFERLERPHYDYTLQEKCKIYELANGLTA